jgi:hypothetical protein
MKEILFILLCFQLLTSCSSKELFTGKWANLDDSLSVNNSKPVYFEKIWYLVQHKKHLCAVLTMEVQSQTFGSPQIYYGEIENDKAVLDPINIIGYGVITFDYQHDQVLLSVIGDRLLRIKPNELWYDFVNNPIQKIRNENGHLKIIYDKNFICQELYKCEEIFNHFEGQ